MIVALEGLDGSGKDTVCTYISDKLKEHDFNVEVIHTPPPPFNEAKTYFNSDSIDPVISVCFFLSGNVWADRIIRKDPNKTYLLNRYIYSTLSYFVARVVIKEQMDWDSACNFAKCLGNRIKLDVDLLILLKPDLEVIKKRLCERNIPDQKLDIVERELKNNFAFLEKFYNFFYDTTTVKMFLPNVSEIEIKKNNNEGDLKCILAFLKQKLR